jgi:hypothetical protein
LIANRLEAVENSCNQTSEHAKILLEAQKLVQNATALAQTQLKNLSNKQNETGAKLKSGNYI